MLSVINKYMEMQQLSQKRQNLMNQKQLGLFKEEVNIRFEKLNMLHEMAIKRNENKIISLQNQFERSKKEQDRLQCIVSEKE